ncbi:M81 family metallopeptidase [Variovorax terrae]|uniref:Microcystinase C n=1 Tax=Variovorax terrae TaxID=2923278 RepID=A0A9X1VUG2_9BURK|nr:M81 family metallopeptidase [Variovorax terrae]MCJ0763483.1 M81 family metallopeptidase [Variovorax terrae]
MAGSIRPRKRLGVARLWYEGNAFCLLPATRQDFERREWRRGRDALEAARGTATELAAVCDFAQAQPGWEVVASRCASALPAGPIDDEVFEAFLAEVLADFRNGPWDAVYLSLHGAGITAGRDAPELDLVRALRQALPQVPMAASFDLHANHAPELVRLLDMGCGYRTYPHVDMRDTAARTLELLRRTAEGELRPVGALRQEGLYLSSANMRTEAGPMAELQRLAQSLIRPPILDVAVFGGFAYANSSNIGASVMAWADADAEAAQRAADTVYAELVRRAGEFDIPLIGPAQGIALALETPGLVAVTDPADNPLSGGIGDTPALLRALVEARPEFPCVFASFADLEVVRTAHAAGIGATLQVSLGGKRTALYGEPVPLTVQVERFTSGRFVNSGPMERGASVDCGPTVVLRAGTILLIVSEHVAPGNDPAFFALHGIDLAATRLLCVKAKNHFRAAFAPLCRAIVDVDAPGPASLNLALLPLRRADRKFNST